MEKKKLTQEIIREDLKERLKTNLLFAILAVVLVLLSIGKFMENQDATSIICLVLTTFLMIIYIGRSLRFVKSYTIQESVVEHVFYDEGKGLYKILVQGLEKSALCKMSFQVGETVYAIVSKGGTLLYCYSKNDYIL